MNSPLTDLLVTLIHRQGPLPFDQFMDQALYEPEVGFYSSGRIRTGRGGDFLTPVSAGSVLGELLARQADELHAILGRPPVLNLIEQGADAGWLVRDLLLAIRQHHPCLAPAIRAHLLEPHPHLEKRQRQTLAEAGLQPSVRWHSSWSAFPKTGIPCFFYSCELVDSFPVKILQFRRSSWLEKWVGAEDSHLVWQEHQPDQKVLNQVRRWNPPEIEDYTLELRPGADSWVKAWAEKIPSGLALTLDYGFPADQLFSISRSRGTLVAIRNHRPTEDPLANPGEQDLTAHVNFTELEELGTKHGFKYYGLTDFARGFTSLAAPQLKENGKCADSWVRNFRHLTHPSFFGHTHKVLVQGKSLPSSFTPTILGKL